MTCMSPCAYKSYIYFVLFQNKADNHHAIIFFPFNLPHHSRITSFLLTREHNVPLKLFFFAPFFKCGQGFTHIKRILSFSASAKIMDEERPFIPEGLECRARIEKSFYPRILWLFCRLGIAMFWLECQFWRLKWPAAWFDRSCHLSFLGVSPKWIFLLRLCSRFTG